MLPCYILLYPVPVLSYHILSCLIPPFPVLSNPALFYSILFSCSSMLFIFTTYHIISYSILSYSYFSCHILFYILFLLIYYTYPIPILFCSVLFFPIRSYLILSYAVFFYSIPFLLFPIISCPVLSYPILSYRILFYSIPIDILYLFYPIHMFFFCPIISFAFPLFVPNAVLSWPMLSLFWPILFYHILFPFFPIQFLFYFFAFCSSHLSLSPISVYHLLSPLITCWNLLSVSDKFS